MVKKTYEEVKDCYGNVVWSKRTVIIDDSYERARREERYPTQYDHYSGVCGISSRKIREAYEDLYRTREW